MHSVKAIFFVLISISSSFGQGMQSSEAEDLFSNKRFSAICPYYNSLLEKDSLNTDLNFKMVVCYLNSRSQKEKSIDCFKKAAASTDLETSTQLIALKLLADACYKTSGFDQAIIYYETYVRIISASNESNLPDMEEAKLKIEMCKMGKELKGLKELTASLLGSNRGGKEQNNDLQIPGYSPELSADQSSLTITFRKPGGRENRNMDNEYFEDNINFPEAGFASQPKSGDTSTRSAEATVAASADGQIILIYRNENGDGNLYASALHGNEWSTPEKLNKIINNKAWEPNEFISADGNT